MKTHDMTFRAVSAVLFAFVLCSCAKESLNYGISSYKMSMIISEDASLTKSSAADSLGRVPTGRCYPLVSGTDTLYLVEYVSDYTALGTPEESADPETKGKIITTSNITGFKMSAYTDDAIEDFAITDSSHPWAGESFASHCANASKGIYFKDLDIGIDRSGGTVTGTMPSTYYWLGSPLSFWSYSNASPTVSDDRGSLSFSVQHKPEYKGSDAELTSDIIVAYNRSLSGDKAYANDESKKGSIDIVLRHAMAVVDFDIKPLND